MCGQYYTHELAQHHSSNSVYPKVFFAKWLERLGEILESLLR